MEGYDFTDETLKIITDYAEKKIDFNELIKMITVICKE